jgi:tetratricopeptide (TPR) repeat protein
MSNPRDSHQKRIKQLEDQGFEYLRSGDFDSALKISEELETLQYTAAFDIAAQAYIGQGQPEKAIAILVRGLKKAPDCWMNWQLLGNCLSDQGRHEKAMQCYERALTCSNVWKDSILLNQAVLSNRKCLYEEALQQHDKLSDDKLVFNIAEARIEAMLQLGRLSEAIDLAQKYLDLESIDGSDEKCKGHIAALWGRAILRQGISKDIVRKKALKMTKLYANSIHLMTLIREIDAKHSRTAHYYRILADVPMALAEQETNNACGYFITYYVMAENPDQGKAFIKEFESVDNTVDLTIDELEILESKPDDLIGIYWRSGRAYYGKEDTE